MTKLTISQKYDEVVKALEGGDVKLSIEELVEFINDRKAKAEKKTASKKPTKTQIANMSYKEAIVDYLSNTNDKLTIVEMIKSIPDFEDFTPQKISALANQLVRDGVIKKDTSTKKSLFYVD